MNLNRRKLFKKIFKGTVAAGAVAAADAFIVEPNLITVSRLALPLKNLPPSFKGKKIALLSDIHLGSCTSKSFLLRAIEKTNALKPDLTLLTGDFTSRYDNGEYYHLIGETLGELRAPLGVYACLGNHDYGLSIKTKKNIRTLTIDQLDSCGVKVLQNSSATLTDGPDSLLLIGLGEIIRGDFYPGRAFENAADTPPQVPRIVMAHNPDCFRRLKDKAFDAFLCGHTHGGQVRIPFIGPLVLPNRDKRFAAGKYEFDEKFIYVNRGLATLPTRFPGPRFLCTPEITIFELADKI